ncbi:MAG TPA: hypothetical protein VJ800_05795 [Pseudolabrys sp.]|nr:hypothetical protein [Pseudolabrys sp.]
MMRVRNNISSFRGARMSAFTRVFDALWPEPGIQMLARYRLLDSGFASVARAPE